MDTKDPLYQKQLVDGEKTKVAITEMTRISQMTDLEEMEYAKLFITAQYEVIMCLAEEKINLMALLKKAAEELENIEIEIHDGEDTEPDFDPSYSFPESKTLH